MALLTTQQIANSGLNPSFVAAAGGGDTFRAEDTVFLVVKNGGGSSITATIATPATSSEGLAIADAAVSVTNGQERWIGPFKDEFRDPATGLVTVTYSGVTSVTVGVFRLG